MRKHEIESGVVVPVHNPISGSAAETVIALGIFFVFIVAALALCARSLGTDLANADGLWMEDYLRDWLVRGVDMTTWQSPMASNYFPEMLIYGLIRYGTGSIYLGFMGFRIVKVILYAILFYQLLAFLTRLSRTYRLWLASLLSCGMVLATMQVGGTQDFWQLYVPGAHGGAFVNTLGALVITLHWLRNPEENRWRTFCPAFAAVHCRRPVRYDLRGVVHNACHSRHGRAGRTGRNHQAFILEICNLPFVSDSAGAYVASDNTIQGAGPSFPCIS